MYVLIYVILKMFFIENKTSIDNFPSNSFLNVKCTLSKM